MEPLKINSAIPDFERDRGFEDVAVSSFDIDRDGDLDLYVGSGGNQEVSPNPSLEDRIYVNDGKGIFKELRFNYLKPILGV